MELKKRQPFRDAQSELAFFFQLHIDKKIGPIGKILRGGHAVFGGVGKDQLDATAALVGFQIGNSGGNQAHRGIFFKHAGGGAVSVALDHAAGRVRSVLFDFAVLQSEGIGDSDVP